MLGGRGEVLFFLPLFLCLARCVVFVLVAVAIVAVDRGSRWNRGVNIPVVLKALSWNLSLCES